MVRIHSPRLFKKINRSFLTAVFFVFIAKPFYLVCVMESGKVNFAFPFCISTLILPLGVGYTIFALSINVAGLKLTLFQPADV